MGTFLGYFGDQTIPEDKKGVNYSAGPDDFWTRAGCWIWRMSACLGNGFGC